MNLIEKLGLEKCQAIVDGAPDWATTYCTAYAAYGATFHWYGACKNCYELPTLCTAIASHEPKMYSHLTSIELQDGDTDNCTDIRNHINPLTEVIER